MKAVKDALIIAWLKSYPELKRQPLMIIVLSMISAIPLFFMAIFTGGNMLNHGIVGALVSTVSFIGVAAAIQDISWDRYVKIREMIVAMPVHPVSYAMGVALAPLLLSTPSLVFFMAVGVWWRMFNLTTILLTTLVLITCWAAMSTTGFVISTYLLKASPWTLNSISNILGIGLIFIPSVYYPEQMLGSLSWISSIIPTSNAAGLIRAYLGLLTLPTEVLMARWLILAITTVVFIGLTALKARWTEI